MLKRIKLKGLGVGLCLVLGWSATLAFGEQGASIDSESSYIEEVLVLGERGDMNILDRSMTVTGFNEAMIDQLGINNNNDLEILTPGLQIGHESPDSGHGNHIYLRGIGSERHQEFFSDTAVATYVDGIYTDEVYGLEQGNLFDIERIEVARGPQGTTGGRSAIAGSLHYWSKRPSEVFDSKFLAEYTDQFSQRYELALGGPIGDSGFMYRVRAGKWMGQGAQENIGPGGNYDEPDQFSITPQLRYKNDHWDINLSWTHTEDKGAPRSSVGLSPRDTTTQCLLFGTDIDGNEVCAELNPYYQSQQTPSITDCSPTANDVVCDSSKLRNVVDHNTVGEQDSELDNIGFDVAYSLNDSLTLNYKFGYRESIDNAKTDVDKTSRTIGGTCPDPANQSPFCALDGAGLLPPNGFYESRYARYNEQTSHEVTLVSDFEGAFNFVAGIYQRDGDEPYDARFFRMGQEAINIDGFEACTGEGGLSAALTPLADNAITSSAAINGLWSCPGTAADVALAGHSNVPGSMQPTTGNPQGHYLSFFGHTAFATEAVYFNADYTVNEDWTVFAGIRHDEETRTHVQNDVRIALAGTNSVTGESYGRNLWYFRNASVEGYEWKKDAVWEDVTWNIGAEYNLNSDQLAYARISQGARAGGFAGFGQPITAGDSFGLFDSERLLNYEVGLKGLFFDSKLQLETALFYMDFQEHWVNSSRLRDAAERRPGESVFEGEMNTIEGSEISGFEIAGAYVVTDKLTLRGFYNYLDSSVGEFTTLYCCDETQPSTEVEFTLNDGTTTTQTIREPSVFTGNTLALMARHKYSVTALYEPEIPYGNLTLLGTYSYTGARHPDLSNLARFELADYARADLRAIWDSPAQDWTVTLYVKNVMDDIAVQQFRPIETGSGADVKGSLTDPREIGLSILWQM